MNEVIKTILSRRSIRKFNDKTIQKEDLDLIINCALHAPSAMARDTWHFSIINNQELIQELIAIMQKLLNNPNYTMYYPKVLIIPANKKDNDRGRDDNAASLENIFIAAKSLNIGTVWINQLKDFMDSEELRSFLRKVDIDDSMVVYGICAMGYYDEEPIAKTRKGTYSYFE